MSEPTRPRITITYCRQCGWLLRAGWLAQELLSTFAEELGEVALVPGTGGVLTVEMDGEVLFDRRRDGALPELGALKRQVRDRVAPERNLGHVERGGGR